MSEDMEFSDCLDNAVAERDPTKRIAHVAAFAMSNYSSTIGRIAKPFNPMLSETFEYVNIKKSYRYIGEQGTSFLSFILLHSSLNDRRPSKR